MRVRCAHQAVLGILLVCQFSVCLGKATPDANESSKYLDAVRTFADNVLKYGRDTYGPKHTPLFVDGLNVNTHEPVKWLSPKGDVLQATEYNEWIISNFAAQQILMRTLDGLSEITGDPKYRNAAKQAIKYVFENLRSQNGLIYWGHAAAYDLQADRVNVEDKRYYQPPYGTFSHCLKLTHPYYELMWRVDPKATQEFIEAFWSAHILDWANLDMNRVGFFNETLEKPWSYEYKGGSVPFQTPHKYVNAFFNTGPILAHAGATLSALSGHEQPLIWSKRLIQRYVDTRDPNIGISAYAYNNSSTSSRRFPVNPFPYRFLDYPEERHVHPWLTVLLIGDMLGENGRSFTQWALEELTAWGKVSYREKDNSFVPMTIDGTNLEGYVDEEAPKGLNVAEACPAGPQYFWAYSVAYQITGDPYMWEMVRNIALGNGLGDVGRTAIDISKLRTQTDCSDAYILLGLLRLYDKTKKPEFLAMARRIGDNIIVNKLHKGFFVQSKKHIYTTFDCLEPLALLHLEATINAQTDSVPTVWPTLRQFVAPYRFKQYGIDRLVIYTLTESNEPPLSLQEAASIGDIDMVRTLVNGGTDVNSRDDILFATALHRAVWNGHKEIVEFLLAKGADVNAKDDQGKTPIDIAMNAKNNRGLTPLDLAEMRDRKEIVQLLIDKGGNVSLYIAARLGELSKVKKLIAERADVDAEGMWDETPLHAAAAKGHKEIAELLIAKEADINAKKPGYTPLTWAVWNDDLDMIKLLVAHGADVNYKPENDDPAFFHCIWSDHNIELAELFVAHGARLDMKDDKGWTVLRSSVQNGNQELVKYFVGKGCKAPAFHLAACLGDLDRVKSFVEKEGTDVDVSDELGWTPLFWAACMGQAEVGEFLLTKGARADTTIENGSTPLHQAAQSGALRLVELLISKGAPVEARDKRGTSPLHRAASTGHAEVAELLISNGSDVNTKAQNNLTPLHQAVLRGHKEIVQLLLKSGADVNAQDNRNRTPLDLAVSGRHSEIVDLLRKRMQVHDLAVTKVSATTSCVQGDTVSIIVTLDNRGDRGESCAVKFMDATNDREIAHQSATIHSKYWGASEADLTFTGEVEDETEFGNWCNANGDVNGDGFNDLLITAHHYPSMSVSRGRAYLYYGGPQMDNTPDKKFTGEESGDTLGGNAGFLVDMNNDGYADVILGARHHNNRGRVYIFYGGKDMDEEPDIIIDPPAGDGTDLSFGRGGMHPGDFNGDGIMDLVCSAVRYKAYMGRVYLYYGPLATDTTVDKIFTGEGTDDTFGAIMGVGDVNGDKCDDLLIATRYYPANTGVGKAYFYYGAPGTSMDITCDVIFDPPDGGKNEFGSSADVFDIDNDGLADVIIGARRFDNSQTNKGRAYFYWGRTSGFDNTVGLTITGEAANSALGGDFINCGYVNDDPYADILVTAYAYNHEQSRAYLYYGNTQVGMDAVADHIFTPEPGRNGVFRSALADLNNDGHGDVVMAGAYYNNLQGRAWLWYGPFNTTTDITFNWDTTNASIGKHTLKVEITPVPGEQNIEDNIKTVTIEVKEPAK